MTESTDETSVADNRRAASPVGCLIVLLLLVAVGAFIAIRRPLPPLNRERFDHAYERWQTTGPANYDITIRVSGRQAAEYHVEVRDGDVATATRNGQPLKQSRTLSTWSVPGMFNTMEIDLENVERHAAGRAAANTPRLSLMARFDPRLGYPEFYQRTEYRDRGSNYDVTFEVIEFAVVK